MDRTSATDYTDIGGGKRGYRDRNLGSGIPGTALVAADRNAIQEELLSVIEAAGITPVAGTWTQLLAAMRTLFAGGMQVYATPGSTSFTVPTGITKIHAKVWGGGGGGGGVGAGGGGASGGSAGGYAEGIYSVTPGQVLAITVGGGGAAGNGTPTAGGNGGLSSVGSLLSATGGLGGQGAAGGSIAPVNGPGGGGSGGALNVTGAVANAGIINGSFTMGSAGGAAFSSAFVGGFSLSSGNSAGYPGGGGGGGGGSTNADGAVGAAGLVVLYW